MTLLRRTKGIFPGMVFLFCCLVLPLSSQNGRSGRKSQAVQTPVRTASKPDTASSSVLPRMTDSLSLAKAPDSLHVGDTSRLADTALVKPKKKQDITEIVDYQAQDSLVFLDGGVGILYNKGSVKYGETGLDAGFIQMNMDSSTLFAKGIPDSVGKIVENPVFKDKSGEYEAKVVRYNFKTGKGLITQVVTQQGEGFVVSGTTKKFPDDVLCMTNGKYTTCDNHEHPHFYLDLSKAKIKTGSYIVSGPAHLVMEDVDLPLMLPFGYFPFKGDYSSGILTPTYGDELSRGFYLSNFGYYFAFNDYMDLALTADVFSKGSWGIKGRSSYKKKYKYTGSFNATYMETVNSEKNLPDYSKTKDLKVSWNHSQDAKANQFSTFSANVDFSTSGYEKNDLASYYRPEVFSKNTKSSSVNYSQRFPESPFFFQANMSISQVARDTTLSVTLPSLSWNVSRIYPFKRKGVAGSDRWYEKISLQYSGSFSNRITNVKEYQFFQKNLIRDWQNYVKHSIPISADFTVLNYINLHAGVNYSENWFSSSLNKFYDQAAARERIDTTWGFNRAYQYSGGVSMSTKLYGMFAPSEKVFGKNFWIKQIRHVLTPDISFNYNPSFSDPKFGYYGTYYKLDASGNEVPVMYSRYAHQGLYPNKQKSGSIAFSVDNNLEMKVRQKTDTAEVDKKISLIDALRFGTSYNLAADSLNWSDISLSIRLKFGAKSINLSTTLNPYTYQLNKNGVPYRTNITQFQKYGIPGRMTGTGTSFSYTFNNDTFKKLGKSLEKLKKGKDNLEEGTGEEDTETDADSESTAETEEENKPYDPEGELYAPAKIPWSLSFAYSLRVQQGEFNKKRLEYDYRLYQNLSLNGRISLTNKWSLTASTSYNFDTKQFAMMQCSVTRDLHCWVMSASFIPIGPYKSYNFSVAVRSSMLSDLKYEQNDNPRDNYIWR